MTQEIKRRRGRPPLSEEVKLQRKLQKEKEKKLKKKEKERKKELRQKKKQLKAPPDKYVKETLKKITENINPLSEDILLTTQPLKQIEDLTTNAFKNISQQSENNGQQIIEITENTNPLSKDILLVTEPLDLVENLLKNVKNTIQQVLEKIGTLENEYLILKTRVKKNTVVMEEWILERMFTNQLIRLEQDILFQKQADLEKFENNQQSYNSLDTPDLIRNILYWCFGNTDEERLMSQIAQSEVKISRRTAQLIEINSELANYLIVVRYDEDKIKVLDKSISDYRFILVELGRDYRNLIKNMKTNKTILNQENIVEEFQLKMKEVFYYL